MGYTSGVWNRKKNQRNSVSSEGTHYRLRAERRPAKHEESKVHNFDGHVRLVESHPIFHNNANDQTIAPILVLPLIRAVHRPLLHPFRLSYCYPVSFSCFVPTHSLFPQGRPFLRRPAVNLIGISIVFRRAVLPCSNGFIPCGIVPNSQHSVDTLSLVPVLLLAVLAELLLFLPKSNEHCSGSRFLPPP